MSKTTSVFPSKELGIIGLNPEETFFISVQKTELPMRGWKKKYIPFTKDNPTGNFVKTDQIMAVKSLIKHISDSRPEIKNVIIDDKQKKLMSSLNSVKRGSSIKKWIIPC